MSSPINIAELVAGYRPGFSLAADFYNTEEIFQRDAELIFMHSWIYACHQSELAAAGDFRLLEVAGESVIVIRTGDGEIVAHVNVCRHRGSRVCLESQGQAKNLVCPYHGWAYDLHGKLLLSREMPADFDKSRYGLKPASVAIVHGLVFVNFDPAAPPLAAITEPLDQALDLFDLTNTKVAFQETWNVQANWKLALENYMECYHCAPAHPEYARMHSLKLPSRLREKLTKPLHEKCASLGIYHHRIQKSGTDNGHALTDIYHDRHPLLNGCVSGSEDGKPLAPMLGDVTGYDGGAADIQIGALFYGLVYVDHAVLYSFLPLSVHSTEMKIVWLVRSDAEPGTDYDRDRLTWLWRVTTDADKTIILNNQLGINSRFYEPGPYSEMEQPTQDFVDWYLDRICRNEAG